MLELSSSASNSNPEAWALTALDVPLGKLVAVVIQVNFAFVVLQVIIAAVVGVAAPGGRGHRGGGDESLANSGLWLPLPQSRNCVPALEESRYAGSSLLSS